MTELTNTPHDKIFRLSLSNLEVAKDFLKNHLPKQILKIINLKNLTVCPNSYITEELAENLSDILYKTNIIHGKQDCYIYTIVEHQSVPLWNMPLRIMQYQLAVIDTHLRQNPKQKNRCCSAHQSHRRCQVCRACLTNWHGLQCCDFDIFFGPPSDRWLGCHCDSALEK